VIAFAAIAPHGTLAVPEAGDGAEATQRAMAELGRRWAASDPEATIVFTPHSVHVEGHFAVGTAERAAGTLAEWDAPNVALEVPLDRGLALACVDALRRDGLPVVGVSYGGNDPRRAVMPLDWGTLIPLWFMGGRTEPQVPAVIVSPARDRSLDEQARAGAAVARAAADRRVALVASADHGHAHDPNGPYGFDPASREYDDRVADAVSRSRLGDLLGLEPSLVEAAAADSWWQLAMLHGALGEGWRAELLSYEAPTYYGMLCATFAQG
jgi:aromatic ring-opening dioxygenase LigB subunit